MQDKRWRKLPIRVYKKTFNMTNHVLSPVVFGTYFLDPQSRLELDFSCKATGEVLTSCTYRNGYISFYVSLPFYAGSEQDVPLSHRWVTRSEWLDYLPRWLEKRLSSMVPREVLFPPSDWPLVVSGLDWWLGLVSLLEDEWLRYDEGW